MSMHMPQMFMQEVILPFVKDPHFPWAPLEWNTEDAERCAQEEGIILGDDHWEVVRILQECLTCITPPRGRQLHDFLDSEFHNKGGLRYLYELFPGGPVAQGCRIAGLTPPCGAIDKSFGTVQ
ncbi:Sulfurtransferase [Gammaproteobacteria bacterium]